MIIKIYTVSITNEIKESPNNDILKLKKIVYICGDFSPNAFLLNSFYNKIFKEYNNFDSF